MKKLIAILLILSLVLVGCTAPDSDNTTPSGPDLHQSAPSEDSSSQTDPTTTLDDVVTTLGPTDPPATTPSAPDSNKNETNGTEGDGPAGSTEGTTPTESQPTSPQPTEKPTTPTDPPEDTKPTTPPETKPTEPPATEPEATDPPATDPEETKPPVTENVVIDFDAAEAYGNAYGVNTYQWVADPSLTMENAGFNFPDTVSMARLQENGGQEYLNRIVKEGVDALYTTLSLYGSPEGCRINCHIELQNSDTVTIYILYG